MNLKSLEDLNAIHMDVLREIGNIGSGNAATALAKLLDITIEIDVPSVNIMEVSEAANALGGLENVMVGILVKLGGDIQGLMMFIIREEFAERVLNTILGQPNASCKHFSEIELSAITEVGNILISSYVNAIATLSGLTISATVPAVAIDMVGALLCVPAAEMGEVSDKIIFIQDDFVTGSTGEKINANIMLIPHIDSLETLMKMLGIDLWEM